jgi:putative ABC transport system ATP-binding protein
VPVLVVSGLRKGFVGPGGERSPVLDVAAFAMEPGEHVALQGASGSGKTTFLHCIAGILKADAGRIAIDGREMTALPEAARDRLRAQALGYVFQTFNLLQGYSALENVQLGLKFAGKRDPGAGRALLERVGLGDRIHHRPRQLSVGQQQRVAVARAIAHRPTLVLADEPTGNLDAERAREALALIREVCRETGAALLLVTHASDLLEGFDRVDRLDSFNRARS